MSCLVLKSVNIKKKRLPVCKPMRTGHRYTINFVLITCQPRWNFVVSLKCYVKR